MRSDSRQDSSDKSATCGRPPNPISARFRAQIVKSAPLRFERLRPLVGIGATAAVLIAILAATLYPFEWVPPRTHNGAIYHSAGGLEFSDIGIARAVAPPPWIAHAIRANKLEIALTVDAASARQRGPARILTLSQDTRHRNLTIGQESRDLVIRLRTPKTDGNGLPPIIIPDVFGQPGWVEIRMSIEPERLTIWIDNELRLDQQLPWAALKRWDPSYQLALGNELTGDRPWLGKIRRALVTAGGESIDYAAPGTIEAPQRYWFFHRRFNFVPLTQTSWSDCLNNFLLFIPLGFVLSLTRKRRDWWADTRLLLFLISISAVIETLQIGLVGRYPSLNDVLFNTMGGMAGVTLARWLARNAKSKLVRQFKRN